MGAPEAGQDEIPAGGEHCPEPSSSADRPEEPAPAPPVVNYSPMGHGWIRNKGGFMINGKPPGCGSKFWHGMDKVKRLDYLNKLRADQGMRQAKTWSQMRVFLTEEHAPYMLPSDHVLPWDVPVETVGVASKVGPVDPQDYSELTTDAGGQSNSERGDIEGFTDDEGASPVDYICTSNQNTLEGFASAPCGYCGHHSWVNGVFEYVPPGQQSVFPALPECPFWADKELEGLSECEKTDKDCCELVAQSANAHDRDCPHNHGRDHAEAHKATGASQL